MWRLEKKELQSVDASDVRRESWFSLLAICYLAFRIWRNRTNDERRQNPVASETVLNICSNELFSTVVRTTWPEQNGQISSLFDPNFIEIPQNRINFVKINF